MALRGSGVRVPPAPPGVKIGARDGRGYPLLRTSPRMGVLTSVAPPWVPGFPGTTRSVARRCGPKVGGCFRTNFPCRLPPAPPLMKMWPAGWGTYSSGAPTSAPHRGYRVSPVRRSWWPAYFLRNHPCRLPPPPPLMKTWPAGCAGLTYRACPHPRRSVDTGSSPASRGRAWLFGPHTNPLPREREFSGRSPIGVGEDEIGGRGRRNRGWVPGFPGTTRCVASLDRLTGEGTSPRTLSIVTPHPDAGPASMVGSGGTPMPGAGP